VSLLVRKGTHAVPSTGGPRDGRCPTDRVSQSLSASPSGFTLHSLLIALTFFTETELRTQLSPGIPHVRGSQRSSRVPRGCHLLVRVYVGARCSCPAQDESFSRQGCRAVKVVPLPLFLKTVLAIQGPGWFYFRIVYLFLWKIPLIF
jgi:hypothetical protein